MRMLDGKGLTETRDFTIKYGYSTINYEYLWVFMGVYGCLMAFICICGYVYCQKSPINQYFKMSNLEVSCTQSEQSIAAIAKPYDGMGNCQHYLQKHWMTFGRRQLEWVALSIRRPAVCTPRD